jgi:hypothetical protein
LQYLLPSPLHIAMPLQRVLKHIGHGQAPFRGRVKRVNARIVPIIGIWGKAPKWIAVGYAKNSGKRAGLEHFVDYSLVYP